MTDRFFVITGGPGAGKTSLLEALASSGWRTSPEAGRRIIQDQETVGGRGTHQTDPGLFAELMLAWDMRAHREALAAPGPVFFDRGVADLVGYHRLMGLDVPAHFRRAAERYRYNRRVFLAPAWRAIFARDDERRQDFDEAVRTCNAIAAACVECGYELVPLPLASVAERMRFVLAECGLTRP